jgi:hypothetical protein
LTELELGIPWRPPEDMQIKDISALKHFVNLTNLKLEFHAITTSAISLRLRGLRS